ncbi:hypothetical protein [Flavivirga eckloniae]|uniref:GNAT family N-acetyltransferase n=1 Tax=Flavivirga eckloniae TaxID=1803846 RepID=A0A2K9PJL3_9FLAO|nr:hypothetical protein [Flavivirga eckloniae]AUP77250.1 hypothetical protein C1H87_00365 [Flavivirga eckloniae]
MQNINITPLTKEMLEDALSQNLYWGENTKVVPFSKNKAKWLLENERIQSEDICAILGYEEDELISFIYLVPDYLATDQGQQKVYWSNRWWIHEKYENSVLSTYSKRLSIESVKEQVLVKYVGEETLEYYKKQSFIEFGKRDKYIFVFSLDHNLIVTKVKSLKPLTPLLKVVTYLSRFFISTINKLKISISNRKTTYKNIDTVDDTVWEFIEKKCEGDLIPKSKAYINWQIDNKQYIDTNGSKETPYKCLVSSVSYKIFNENILVFSNNKIVGFFSALIRGDEYVLRYFLPDEDYYSHCLDILMKRFIKSKCTYILTDNENLGKQIHHKFLCIYANKKEQVSLAHSSINYNFTNVKISEQDGHFA